MKTKVQNMESPRSGRPVANQFIIENAVIEIADGHSINGRAFQSYRSIIAVVEYSTGTVYLDAHYWDYSVTTGRYRNEFLREGITDTRAKIKDGTYKLANLN